MTEADYAHRERRAIVAEGCGVGQVEAERIMMNGWRIDRPAGGGLHVVGPDGQDAELSVAGELTWYDDEQIGAQYGSTKADLVELLRRWQAPNDVIAQLFRGGPW